MLIAWLELFLIDFFLVDWFTMKVLLSLLFSSSSSLFANTLQNSLLRPRWKLWSPELYSLLESLSLIIVFLFVLPHTLLYYKLWKFFFLELSTKSKNLTCFFLDLFRLGLFLIYQGDILLSELNKGHFSNLHFFL